jgi:hypothetical protein
VHWPFGSAPPAGTGVQVPSVPASPHETQLALQAVAQQTPCAHWPLRHSTPVPQLAPFGLRPHEPPVHTAGGAQSAFAPQIELQAATPQRNGKQEVAAGVMQLPAPSQVAWRTRVVLPEAQVAAAHGVPSAYFWQAPASHLPLVPQLAGSRSTQVCDGSGAPVGTLVQMPIEPASAQERHAPMQSVPQQIPWAHLPDMHSGPLEQNAPFAFLPHEFAMQTLPGEQFASALHAP